MDFLLFLFTVLLIGTTGLSQAQQITFREVTWKAEGAEQGQITSQPLQDFSGFERLDTPFPAYRVQAPQRITYALSKGSLLVFQLPEQLDLDSYTFWVHRCSGGGFSPDTTSKCDWDDLYSVFKRPQSHQLVVRLYGFVVNKSGLVVTIARRKNQDSPHPIWYDGHPWRTLKTVNYAVKTRRLNVLDGLKVAVVGPLTPGLTLTVSRLDSADLSPKTMPLQRIYRFQVNSPEVTGIKILLQKQDFAGASCIISGMLEEGTPPTDVQVIDIPYLWGFKVHWANAWSTQTHDLLRTSYDGQASLMVYTMGAYPSQKCQNLVPWPIDFITEQLPIPLRP